MRIISNLPKERWVEYRDLRIQALLDVPHAFLDEPEQAKKLEPGEWQRKMKNMIFAEDDGKLIGMIGAYREDKEKLKQVCRFVENPQFTMAQNRGYVDLQMLWETFKKPVCFTFGAGEENTAHKPNEYVKIDKLETATNFWEKFGQKD